MKESSKVLTFFVLLTSYSYETVQTYNLSPLVNKSNQFLSSVLIPYSNHLILFQLDSLCIHVTLTETGEHDDHR